MKVDLELISFALDGIFEQSEVSSLGAISLRMLTEYWESIALRSSDLAAGIVELHKLGRINLETRRDGIWVRRRGEGGAPEGAVRRMQANFRRLMGSLMFAKVRRRQNDGYSGVDRRLHRRSSAEV